MDESGNISVEDGNIRAFLLLSGVSNIWRIVMGEK
jgi:hypothetical protein